MQSARTFVARLSALFLVSLLCPLPFASAAPSSVDGAANRAARGIEKGRKQRQDRGERDAKAKCTEIDSFDGDQLQDYLMGMGKQAKAIKEAIVEAKSKHDQLRTEFETAEATWRASDKYQDYVAAKDTISDLKEKKAALSSTYDETTAIVELAEQQHKGYETGLKPIKKLKSKIFDLRYENGQIWKHSGRAWWLIRGKWLYAENEEAIKKLEKEQDNLFADFQASRASAGDTDIPGTVDDAIAHVDKLVEACDELPKLKEQIKEKDTEIQRENGRFERLKWALKEDTAYKKWDSLRTGVKEQLGKMLALEKKRQYLEAFASTVLPCVTARRLALTQEDKLKPVLAGAYSTKCRYEAQRTTGGGTFRMTVETDGSIHGYYSPKGGGRYRVSGSRSSNGQISCSGPNNMRVTGTCSDPNAGLKVTGSGKWSSWGKSWRCEGTWTSN